MATEETSPEYEEYQNMELQKKLLDGRHSILVVKPSGKGFEAECPALDEKYPINVLLESLFAASGLEIEERGISELQHKDVLKIYSVLSEPSEFGDEWKNQVVEHMVSEPIEYYLLVGDEAEVKSTELKRAIRGKWLDKTSVQSSVVENLIHVADQADLIETYKALKKQ